MRIALILAAVTLAVPALGQGELPPMNDAMAAVDGQEVTVRGVLGKAPTTGFYLLPQVGDPYKVRFAVGRQDLKSVEECVFDYGWRGGCSAEVSAQIEVYGATLRLLVFEISDLRPAEPPG